MKLVSNFVTIRLFNGMPDAIGARLSDGVVVDIDPQDHDGRVLWVFGCSDYRVLDTVKALLSPGDILLDIGANYSAIGILARHAVAPAGHVHLFEPQPMLAHTVRRAIAAADIGSLVTLHELALFDRDARLEMYVSSHHSGLGQLLADREGTRAGDPNRVEVIARSTFDYLSPLLGDRPFGVKLDVEGAEPPIIADLLKFPALKFFVFEGNRNEDVLFRLVGGSGYSIYGLQKTMFSVRLQRIEALAEWAAFNDFVAVRQEVGQNGHAVSLAGFARSCHAAWQASAAGSRPGVQTAPARTSLRMADPR